MAIRVVRAITVASSLLTAGFVCADISLVAQNRVIFEEVASNRIRLDISNQGDRRALVNISLDWGDERSATIPMAISPPLLTIPARQQKSVQLFYEGVGLPQDRESYFLLSLLDVPVATKSEGALQVALRHRYKLFYRPKLELTPQEAAAQLSWQALPGQAGVKALNPSPYYLTLTHFTALDARGQTCGDVVEHTMIAPFSDKNLGEKGCSGSIAQLKYNLVSENGREVEHIIKVKK
jgi:P pilus assembly chaperone PapD